MADDTETRGELANVLRWSPGWSDALPESQRPLASARYILASSWLAARDAAVAERAWDEGRRAVLDAPFNDWAPTPNPYRERP